MKLNARFIRLAVVLLVAFVAVPAAPANPLRRIGRYIAHHKELLAQDSLIVLPWAADAASSVRCQHTSPHCVELNPILGRHPSELASWGYMMGFAGVTVACFHGLHAVSGDDTALRRIPWFIVAPVVVDESLNVSGNVHLAERLSGGGR